MQIKSERLKRRERNNKKGKIPVRRSTRKNKYYKMIIYSINEVLEEERQNNLIVMMILIVTGINIAKEKRKKMQRMMQL